MELKNMNGFCELSENTMMEIDGGARRVVQGGPVRTDAATARQAVYTQAAVTIGIITWATAGSLKAFCWTVGSEAALELLAPKS